MQGLGKRLRERAAELGLSDSEVARRLDMSQARYHNYVAETAEPDLGSLLRICRVLSTTPDSILGLGDTPVLDADDALRCKLVSAVNALKGEALAYTVDIAEAMVASQRRRSSTKPKRHRGRNMPQA